MKQQYAIWCRQGKFKYNLFDFRRPHTFDNMILVMDLGTALVAAMAHAILYQSCVISSSFGGDV